MKHLVTHNKYRTVAVHNTAAGDHLTLCLFKPSLAIQPALRSIWFMIANVNSREKRNRTPKITNFSNNIVLCV